MKIDRMAKNFHLKKGVNGTRIRNDRNENLIERLIGRPFGIAMVLWDDFISLVSISGVGLSTMSTHTFLTSF